jgi:hypothetical protein
MQLKTSGGKATTMERMIIASWPQILKIELVVIRSFMLPFASILEMNCTVPSVNVHGKKRIGRWTYFPASLLAFN